MNFIMISKLTYATLIVLGAASKAVIASYTLLHATYVTIMPAARMSARVRILPSTVYLLTFEVIAVIVLLFFP